MTELQRRHGSGFLTEKEKKHEIGREESERRSVRADPDAGDGWRKSNKRKRCSGGKRFGHTGVSNTSSHPLVEAKRKFAQLCRVEIRLWWSFTRQLVPLCLNRKPVWQRWPMRELESPKVEEFIVLVVLYRALLYNPALLRRDVARFAVNYGTWETDGWDTEGRMVQTELTVFTYVQLRMET